MVDFRYIYMEAVSATARSVADYIFVGHRVLPQPNKLGGLGRGNGVLR